MKKIKKGDKVKVIAGKFKGTVSTVENVSGDLALVKGVNICKRAMKGKGIIEVTKPIHISNIMYYVDSLSKPSRMAITIDKKSGKKQRITKIGSVVVA